MIDIKFKKPSVGFYLLVASTVLAIAAFVMYSLTYDALTYASDKWVIASMVIAFWCLGCLMLTSVISGNGAKITDVFYWLGVMSLTLALFKFITPCLSPIGVYFTVNMGNMEAYSIGVPRGIAGAVLYVLSVLSLIVSAFFSPTVSEKKKEKKRKTNDALFTLAVNVDEETGQIDTQFIRVDEQSADGDEAGETAENGDATVADTIATDGGAEEVKDGE
ncbi:MAG: hypothetical protein J1G38_04905 [Clostridiales bacterium]|nr:hypothetical protein [Clostridiales bacterium]